MISGKPVDISVHLLSWYFGYHGNKEIPWPPGSPDRIFPSLEDFSSPVAFDHGTGNGHDGILELMSTDVIHPEPVPVITTPPLPEPELIVPDKNLIGVYIAPINNHSNRFRVRDEAWLKKLLSSTDELPVGSSRPVGISEADAIGFSTLSGVYFGTGGTYLLDLSRLFKARLNRCL